MPHIPKAICVPCRKEYRIKKTGFEVCMEVDGKPYYQISANLWECPICGHQIVTGFAQQPNWKPYIKDKPYKEPDLTANF